MMKYLSLLLSMFYCEIFIYFYFKICSNILTYHFSIVTSSLTAECVPFPFIQAKILSFSLVKQDFKHLLPVLLSE